MNKLQKAILVCFKILFFLVPIILWPYTSELFEFNKMIVVYFLTIIISSLWLIRMNTEKRVIFRRTILDIPFAIFLASQFISTLISIDPQTSWLGYYSRFNGGLLSTISYLTLYWAFVSNVDKQSIRKLISVMFWSAAIVSIYGVLEHLGIDKNVWQQAVQQRVFSTLGQPNWLAAWLVTLLPLTWIQTFNDNAKKIDFKRLLPYILSTLFFAVVLFTGSRSGLFGLAIAALTFWVVIFLISKFKFIRQFLILNGLILLMVVIFGTQFTPSVFQLFSKSSAASTPAVVGGTALETGGTESGDIRKIVWKGAIDVWKNYPIFGTGVETFAYSYYLYRPAAHNMTSEWDFIYNKAHNEYLNFMANSGTVGILSYLGVIGVTIYFLAVTLRKNDDDVPESYTKSIYAALLAGYLSILATNFFGFSVVPVQLLFYLYPAFAIVIALPEMQQGEYKSVKFNKSNVTNWIIVILASYLLIITCRYWYADYLYATGYNYNRVNRQDLSPDYLARAIKIEPKQSLYYSELAKSYAGLALAYNEAKQSTPAAQLTEAAIINSAKSVELSPANVNLKRIEFGIYVMLSGLNPNYLINARDILIEAAKQAPTDAKIYYNLGLIYSRVGQSTQALEVLQKTVDLKPNYKDARLALGILLSDTQRFAEAKTQFEYVLANIDPEDTVAKQYLQNIK